MLIAVIPLLRLLMLALLMAYYARECWAEYQIWLVSNPKVEVIARKNSADSEKPDSSATPTNLLNSFVRVSGVRHIQRYLTQMVNSKQKKKTVK